MGKVSKKRNSRKKSFWEVYNELNDVVLPKDDMTDPEITEYMREWMGVEEEVNILDNLLEGKLSGGFQPNWEGVVELESLGLTDEEVKGVLGELNRLLDSWDFIDIMVKRRELEREYRVMKSSEKDVSDLSDDSLDMMSV